MPNPDESPMSWDAMRWPFCPKSELKKEKCVEEVVKFKKLSAWWKEESSHAVECCP